jgi:hypothetical protein
VCGANDAASRLRLIGLLRREKDPDEDALAELLIDAAPRMTCPGCRAKGTLRATPSEALPEDWEDGNWQAAVLCEICRQPIPFERLEALPGSRRCVDCQGKAETGSLAEDEPEYCPKCGALVELRVSRGTGITRYKRCCTGVPPCRI